MTIPENRKVVISVIGKNNLRQDIYELPPDSIRELIANALVHRSYLEPESVDFDGDLRVNLYRTTDQTTDQTPKTDQTTDQTDQITNQTN